MIRKLAPYTKGYRIWIILGVLCSAGEAVLELLLPKAMSQIVDVGIANGDKAYILAMGLKMILMALASLVMGVGAAALAARMVRGDSLAETARWAVGAGALACEAETTINPAMCWDNIETILNRR